MSTQDVSRRKTSGWLLVGAACIASAGMGALAAIPNADVPPFGSLSAESDGQKLYQTICLGCHMPDGRGAQGAGMYPALAANPKLGSAAYPEYIVLNGLRGMPAIGQHLTDAQVGAVVTYVITHFGNQSPQAATAAEVAALRANPPLR